MVFCMSYPSCIYGSRFWGERHPSCAKLSSLAGKKEEGKEERERGHSCPTWRRKNKKGATPPYQDASSSSLCKNRFIRIEEEESATRPTLRKNEQLLHMLENEDLAAVINLSCAFKRVVRGSRCDPLHRLLAWTCLSKGLSPSLSYLCSRNILLFCLVIV